MKKQRVKSVCKHVHERQIKIILTKQPYRKQETEISLEIRNQYQNNEDGN